MRRLAIVSLLVVLTVVPLVSPAAQQDSQLQDAHRFAESFVGDWSGSVAWQKESESEPGIMVTRQLLALRVSIEQSGQHTISAQFSRKPSGESELNFSLTLEYNATQEKYLLTYESDVFPNFERLPLTYSDIQEFSGKGEVSIEGNNMALEVRIVAQPSGGNVGLRWIFVVLDSDGEHYIQHLLDFTRQGS